MHDTLPPGPTAHPALQLFRWVQSPLAVLDENARRFGDAFTLRMLGVPPMVILREAAAIRDVFNGDPEVLYAGEGHFVVEPLVGSKSLLILDGARHVAERRLLLPPFHGERMRAYGVVMRDVTDTAIDRWAPGVPIVAHDEMQRITMEVILHTVFGLSDEARLSWWRPRLAELLSCATSTSVLMAAYALRAPRMKRWMTRVPNLRLGSRMRDPAARFSLVRLYRLLAETDAMMAREIAARREAGAEAGGDDILSLLVAARDEAGNGLDDAELRDEMMTLLLTGYETSSTTLALALHFVLSSPPVLARVRDELRAVSGGGPLRPDDVARLEILDAVLKETLRLVPIVPVVTRRLRAPMVVAGMHLPAGTIVAPCPYLAQRRPGTWDAPEEFRPERFLGRRTAHEYLPFGGGARRCIGMAFANYEMKVVLAEVFSRADLRLAATGPLRVVRRHVTMAPAGGVPLVVDGVRPRVLAAA